MSRTAFYYEPKQVDDSEIIDAPNKRVEEHQRWGFPKCYKRLRALGYLWNHKRVYRVYKTLNLNIRRKTKRRLPTRSPEPLCVPSTIGHTWSMDFMSDARLM